MNDINIRIDINENLSKSGLTLSQRFIYKKKLSKVRIISDYNPLNKIKGLGMPVNLNDFLRQFPYSKTNDSSGIYYLFRNKRLLYIGMSRNIIGRILQHRDKGEIPFNYIIISCISDSLENIIEMEERLIKEFLPPFNTVHAVYRNKVRGKILSL